VPLPEPKPDIAPTASVSPAPNAKAKTRQKK